LYAGILAVRADVSAADGDVKIAVQDGGGYLVTTTSYQARINADGNLHSFLVNGVEFLDDHTPSSMGASFFVERPIALPTLKQREREITASDGTYTVRYQFDPGYLSLTLRHTNRTGAAYVAVCSPKIAYVENLATNSMAAAPADYNWANAKVTMPTGENLELHGGSRVWGREIDRQVWECSNLVPNREYSLMLIPGRGVPPAPDLGQLTNLSIALLNHPDQLIPAGEAADVRVRLENNSNRAIATEMTVRIASSAGTLLLDEKKPVSCAPHQAATLTWRVAPPTADFYAVTCAVNLDGAPKSAATHFGFNTPAITGVVQTPDDWREYWDRVQAEAKAADVKLSMLEDSTRSTGTVRVYEVGIQADGFSYSGWLSVPKYPGRYPGLLILPSDRVRSLTPSPALADCGFVVMSIEPTGQSVRANLTPVIARASTNLTNPALFGARAIIIRYLRALTALASVPEVDEHRLAVTGAGLGGGMALLLSALDDRIQAVAPDVPYYCFIEQGSTQPEWPYLEVQDYLHDHPEQRDAVLRTLRYYDAVNFAPRITCPVLISAGIDDPYARPATIMGVANRLPGPHAVRIYRAGHEGGGIRHWEEKMRWLTKVLGGPSPVIPTPTLDAPERDELNQMPFEFDPPVPVPQEAPADAARKGATP
jgi:cephalosporin-C deacetylase